MTIFALTFFILVWVVLLITFFYTVRNEVEAKDKVQTAQSVDLQIELPSGFVVQKN